MKRVIFILAVFAGFIFAGVCDAQVKAIITAAGGISNGGYAGDGLKATDPSVMLNRATGVCVDNAGNLYIGDNGNARVRKVDAGTGIIHTIAGNGVSGYSGDGGPAVSAQINSDVFGLCLDNAGNLYIADQGNNVIRKVNAATGIISTVAGGGISDSDDVSAFAAVIHTPNVYVDASGNIYFTAINRIRMVSAATGLVSTIAGNGFPGKTGDGSLATAAQVSNPDAITGDAFGNIYFADEDNNEIRKINTAGIISTIAGTGIAGYAGDGGPAISARLNAPRAISIDVTGTIYFSDGAPGANGYIRRIDAVTGIIGTIAGCSGCPVVGYDTAGTKATKESVDGYYLYAASSGRIYYSEYAGLVKTLNNPIYSTDSFSVFVNALCNGPELTLYTASYIAGRSVKTNFGDGTIDSSIILPGFGTGYTIIDHSYPNAGTYSITQVLYNGASAVDTLTFSYVYSIFCRTLPVKLYNDDNGNCIKDGVEQYATQPSLIEVDSNSISIDTLSAISGFSYNAYGSPGDIYSFRFLSDLGVLMATCPSTAIISETLFATDTTYSDQYFGLACKAGTWVDLSINAVIPVTGMHDQWGLIYVHNRSSCTPTDASVTLFFSPKYVYTGSTDDARPTPASASANSITWNITGLSSEKADSVTLYYAIYDNPAIGFLTAGDTVQEHIEVTPIVGDINPINNIEIIIDTVRASCDPNEMSVSPVCVPYTTGTTQLQYTINFENTGNDTAFNIYVMDTFSADIDIKSLRLIMASATMNIELMKNGNYNIARFDFPNINLLDSSHHGACDGAVIFTVNTFAGFPSGTTIYNHAGIFFDDNAVVMTDTASTTLGGCTALGVATVTAKPDVVLYPNPTTDELTIKMDNVAYNSYTIANSIGQVMQQNKISAAQTTLSVKTLPAGLYYITLRGENGSKVMKFVKM